MPAKSVAKGLIIVPVLMLIGAVVPERQPATSRPTAPARIVPLLRCSSDAVRFTVVFENNGAAPIRYIPEGDGLPPHIMVVSASREGRPLMRRLGQPQVARLARNIRVLPPSGQIVATVDLNEIYGPMEAGRYLVEIEITGTPAGLGLTPFAARQDLYVDVHSK